MEIPYTVDARPDAEPQLGPADLGHHGRDRLRRRGQFQLAEQRLGPGRLAGEPDGEQLEVAIRALDESLKLEPQTV